MMFAVWLCSMATCMSELHVLPCVRDLLHCRGVVAPSRHAQLGARLPLGPALAASAQSQAMPVDAARRALPPPHPQCAAKA